MKFLDWKKIILSILLAISVLLPLYYFSHTKTLILTGIIFILLGIIIIYRNNHSQFKERPEPDPDLYQKIESLKNIRNELNPDYPLPHMDGFALSPIAIDEIIQILINKNLRTIVEFGSGSSTVILAGILKKLGTGTVYSFDHLEKYAQKTKKMLNNHDYSNQAKVFHSPLTKRNFHGKEFKWYDLVLAEIINEIDMLIIDGPPGRLENMVRKPGLIASTPLLSEESFVLVDDTHREDEKSMVTEWKQQNPSFETLPLNDPNVTLLGRTTLKTSN